MAESRTVLFITVLAVVAAICQADCSSLNNCSSHGQCQGDKCVCHIGWGGEDCSMQNAGCPSFCFGHGSCMNGTCLCDTGYAGDACNIVVPACPNNCTGHGICEDGACTCVPGVWTGAACDQEVYMCPGNLKNCSGRGSCGPSKADATVWTCDCDEGFCGETCDTVCGTCPRNCSGHGLCHRGTCVCSPGFAGRDCSLVNEVAACANNCSGHGLCQQSNGTFGCVCDSCYSGSDCSESSAFCPGNCSGRGMCDCSGKCHCQAGFSGVACENVEKTCSHLNFCSGNGKCTANDTCKCNPGFAGRVCSLACHTGGGNATVGCRADKAHGTCIEANGTAVCLCKPEYDGVGCENEVLENPLDEFVNGWNPVGTIMIGLVASCVVAFFVGVAVNFNKGLRGVNAMPGVNSIRSKVNGSDYETSLLEGQRNVSNY